jgi:hypothetical protein
MHLCSTVGGLESTAVEYVPTATVIGIGEKDSTP